jgi:hypothetical protein
MSEQRYMVTTLHGYMVTWLQRYMVKAVKTVNG